MNLLSVRIEEVDFQPEPFSLECPGPEDLNTIYRNYAPYLYPFVSGISIEKLD
jgi:hypothetical protein